jgi:hypothetical protein
MAIEIVNQVTGFKAVTEASGALRVSQRPNDVGTFGSYQTSQFSGTNTGVSLGATIFSFRWTDVTRLCIIRKVSMRMSTIAAATVLQELGVYCSVARNWTTPDSAGNIMPAASKKRASMGASVQVNANMQHISGAAGLTQGTKVLDPSPFLVGQTSIPANSAGTIECVFDATDPSRYPLVLAANEGFVVNSIANISATGSARFIYLVEWDEVASY